MAHLIKLELKKFGTARNIIFTFAAILFSKFFWFHSLRLELLYLLSRRKCQNYINSICRATAKKKSRRSTDTIHAYLLLRRL